MLSQRWPDRGLKLVAVVHDQMSNLTASSWPNAGVGLPPRLGYWLVPLSELSPTHFLVETDGPVMTVTFNRPERRNGLNAHVLGELEAIVRYIRDDGRTRAVILTGAGTVFCAGPERAAVAKQAEMGGDLSVAPALGLALLGASS